MARVCAAFVDIDAFVVLRRPESWSALADGFAVFHLAESVVAFHRIARIDAFEGLLVASPVLWTIFVLDTVDAEAAEFGVVGISSSRRRAGARRLVIDDGADGIGTASG